MSFKQRTFLHVPGAEPATAALSIRVLSYNVLAQCLVQRTMFPYASRNALRVKPRRQLLADEILHWHPDILCLQEVEKTDEWFGIFRKAGYDLLYKKSDLKRHGCCIMWRRDRFERKYFMAFDFDGMEVAPPAHDTNSVGQIVVLRARSAASLAADAGTVDPNADMLPDFFAPLTLNESAPVAKAAIAAAPEGEFGIVVGNHHLFWPPAAHYEKLRQSLVMLKYVTEMWRFHGEGRYAAIMCGDYNTCPNDPTYPVLTQGGGIGNTLVELPEENMEKLRAIPAYCLTDERRAADGEGGGTLQSEDEMNASAPSKVRAFPASLHLPEKLLQHRSSLPRCRSVFASYTDLDPANLGERWSGEPRWTNYTSGWKGTLDYMFIVDTTSIAIGGADDCMYLRAGKKDGGHWRLQPRQLLGLPDEELLKPGLPNNSFGSDHICMAADLTLVPPR